jgi:hypothetical protein
MSSDVRRVAAQRLDIRARIIVDAAVSRRTERREVMVTAQR